MRVGRTILVSIGLLLAVAMAGAFYLANYLDQHRDLLEAGVSKALGREVRIKEGVKVHWSMTPSVVLEGLWIGNADWAEGPHLARASRAVLSFELMPLLSRRLEISEVALLDADVFLETAEDGTYNWYLGHERKGGDGVAVEIDVLRVEDSSLHYRSAVGSDHDLVIPKFEFGWSGDRKLVLEGDLLYQSIPLSLSGTVRHKAVAGSDARSLAMRVQMPDAMLDISGDFTGIRNFSRLQMDLKSDQFDLRKRLSPLWPAVAFDGSLKTLNAQLNTSGDTPESLIGNTSGELKIGSAVLKLPTGKEAKAGSVVLDGLSLQIAPGKAVELRTALAYAGQSYRIRLRGGSFADLFLDRKSWARLKVSAKGTPAGRPVEMTGELGPWTAGKSAGGLGMNLTLRDEALTVGLKGRLARFDTLQGSRFAVKASAPSLGRLNPWLGVTMPDSAPFVFSANVEGGARQLSLKDLKLTAGDSDVSGTLNVPLAPGGRFEAILQSRVLDLRPYLAASGQGSEDAVPVLERELAPDALQGLDGTLRYKVDRLKTDAMKVAAVSLDATLDKGHLKFTLVAENESLKADVDLRPSDTHWQLALKHKGKLKLGTLVAMEERVPDSSRPLLETELTLKATGSSVGAMLDTANGQFLMLLGPGELSERLTPNLPLGDVLLVLLDAINHDEQTGQGPKLECAVIQMDIAEGIATSSKGLALRTDKMNVLGGGALKLRTGEIDLHFKTAYRKGLGISLLGIADRLVRLSGTLNKPEVAVNVGGAVVYGAAAWATGGLTILYDTLYKRLTAFSNPCDTVLEAIEKPP